jgi:hypothetical protein
MTDPDRMPTSTRVPLGSTKPRRERSNMSTQSSQSGASSGERLENDAFGESPSIDGTGAVVRVPHLLAFLCSIACKRQFQRDDWHSLMAEQEVLVAVSLWSMHDMIANSKKCCCPVCTYAVLSWWCGAWSGLAVQCVALARVITSLHVCVHLAATHSSS